MNTLQKKKGPASAATDPDHGSNPTKDIKNMKEHSTAAAERQEKDHAASDELCDRAWELLNDMETKVLKVKNLTEVLWMAADSLSLKQANAITAQCDAIDDLIREALDLRGEVASMILGRVPA